ncbi:hypothetical protein [Shinella sp. NM-101]|uniref:hypothetical protein n=1 Tax=Shinella sp. NM-101 TaxID=2744455 RepID=UPI001F465744
MQLEPFDAEQFLPHRRRIVPRPAQRPAETEAGRWNVTLAFTARNRLRLRYRLGTHLGTEGPFDNRSFGNGGFRVAYVFHATLLAFGHNHSFARRRPSSRPGETRQSFGM